MKSNNDLIHLDPVNYQHVASVTVGLNYLYKNSKYGRNKHGHGKTDESDKGKYHPCPGEILARRYKILQILSKLGESAILLRAQDMYIQTEVTIKVLHVKYYGIGIQEAHLLTTLKSADPYHVSHTVRLLATFKHEEHYCMVFESLNPEPISELPWFTQTYNVQKKLQYIRKLTVKLLQVLSFLQQQNMIHADLKPENILLKHKNDLDSIRVIDFGNAIHHVHEEVSMYYEKFELQTLLYRAPEVMFGIPFGCEVDMWSLGCIIAELFLGQPLFLGENKRELIIEIVDVLGPLPTEIFQRGKFYKDLSQFTSKHTTKDATLELLNRLTDCYDYTFANFLSGILKLSPDERLTPLSALQHPFLASEFNMGMVLKSDGSKDSVFILKPEDYTERPKISPDIKRQNPTSYDLLQLGTTSEPCQNIAVVCPFSKSKQGRVSVVPQLQGQGQIISSLSSGAVQNQSQNFYQNLLDAGDHRHSFRSRLVIPYSDDQRRSRSHSSQILVEDTRERFSSEGEYLSQTAHSGQGIQRHSLSQKFLRGNQREENIGSRQGEIDNREHLNNSQNTEQVFVDIQKSQRKHNPRSLGNALSLSTPCNQNQLMLNHRNCVPCHAAEGRSPIAQNERSVSSKQCNSKIQPTISVTHSSSASPSKIRKMDRNSKRFVFKQDCMNSSVYQEENHSHVHTRSSRDSPFAGQDGSIIEPDNDDDVIEVHPIGILSPNSNFEQRHLTSIGIEDSEHFIETENEMSIVSDSNESSFEDMEENSPLPYINTKGNEDKTDVTSVSEEVTYMSGDVSEPDTDFVSETTVNTCGNSDSDHHMIKAYINLDKNCSSSHRPSVSPSIPLMCSVPITNKRASDAKPILLPRTISSSTRDTKHHPIAIPLCSKQTTSIDPSPNLCSQESQNESRNAPKPSKRKFFESISLSPTKTSTDFENVYSTLTKSNIPIPSRKSTEAELPPFKCNTPSERLKAVLKHVKSSSKDKTSDNSSSSLINQEPKETIKPSRNQQSQVTDTLPSVHKSSNFEQSKDAGIQTPAADRNSVKMTYKSLEELDQSPGCSYTSQKCNSLKVEVKEENIADGHQTPSDQVQRDDNTCLHFKQEFNNQVLCKEEKIFNTAIDHFYSPDVKPKIEIKKESPCMETVPMTGRNRRGSSKSLEQNYVCESFDVKKEPFEDDTQPKQVTTAITKPVTNLVQNSSATVSPRVNPSPRRVSRSFESSFDQSNHSSIEQSFLILKKSKHPEVIASNTNESSSVDMLQRPSGSESPVTQTIQKSSKKTTSRQFQPRIVVSENCIQNQHGEDSNQSSSPESICFSPQKLKRIENGNYYFEGFDKYISEKELNKKVIKILPTPKPIVKHVKNSAESELSEATASYITRNSTVQPKRSSTTKQSSSHDVRGYEEDTLSRQGGFNARGELKARAATQTPVRNSQTKMSKRRINSPSRTQIKNILKKLKRRKSSQSCRSKQSEKQHKHPPASHGDDFEGLVQQTSSSGDCTPSLQRYSWKLLDENVAKATKQIRNSRNLTTKNVSENFQVQYTPSLPSYISSPEFSRNESNICVSKHPLGHMTSSDDSSIPQNVHARRRYSSSLGPVSEKEKTKSARVLNQFKKPRFGITSSAKKPIKFRGTVSSELVSTDLSVTTDTSPEYEVTSTDSSQIRFSNAHVAYSPSQTPILAAQEPANHSFPTRLPFNMRSSDVAYSPTQKPVLDSPYSNFDDISTDSSYPRSSSDPNMAYSPTQTPILSEACKRKPKMRPKPKTRVSKLLNAALNNLSSSDTERASVASERSLDLGPESKETPGQKSQERSQRQKLRSREAIPRLDRSDPNIALYGPVTYCARQLSKK